MNIFSRRGAIHCALMLGLLLGQAAEATAPRFTLKKPAGEAPPHLVAYEYPPLVTGEANRPGAAVELVNQALAAMGKSIPLEVVSSRSYAAQRLTDDPSVVATLGEAHLLSATEQKALVEEKCLRLTGQYFYYRPTRGEALARIGNFKALKGRTYGALPGEPTEAYAKAGIAVAVDEPKMLLRRLQAGEIDFVSGFEPHETWLIDRLFPAEKGQFAKLPFQAWESTYSLWFNLGHKSAGEWRLAFSEGLKKLRQSGAYGEILQRYGLGDWALKP